MEVMEPFLVTLLLLLPVVGWWLGNSESSKLRSELYHLRGVERRLCEELRLAKLNAEPFPEPDQEDVAEVESACLRVGMRVVCHLSEASHTHGVLLGFTMGMEPGGPMLAVVDVGDGSPAMPIDVDMVEPVAMPEPGYRDNANPNKPN